MAQNSQVDSTALLEAQVRECFGRVVYSHKTHEKCADILHSRLGRIKLAQLILSALTTAGFISALFGDSKLGIILGLVLSTALIVLNAYTKDYDLGELAQKHKGTANDLWLIRERYLSLLTDIRSCTKEIEQLYTERDALMAKLHTIYSASPSTNYEAYKKAQEALQFKEDMTFSDVEIDAFLPTELKKNPSQ